MEDSLVNFPAEREIVTTRILGAPREEVFNAWTDPAILAKWWGPNGFTNTFHEFEPRPGGKWRFTMHGPDKGNYENECVFSMVDRPSMIVWDRVSQPLFRMVVTFDATDDNRTKVVFRMRFDTKEACDKIRTFAPEKNEENFDRLEAELKKLKR